MKIHLILLLAIPFLGSPGPLQGEAEAVRSMRRIVGAQNVLAATGDVDTDADGVGEYGYFGELTGADPLRIYDPALDGPALGVPGVDELDPPLLTPPFGDVVSDLSGHGIVEARGYLFKMFLPGDTKPDGRVPGIAESVSGGASATLLPSPANGAMLWGCYAWPAEAGSTGQRVFFVNQEGVLLYTANRDDRYTGASSVPRFDAAYSNETGGDDMAAPLGITAQITPLGFSANDGNVWKIVP